MVGLWLRPLRSSSPGTAAATIPHPHMNSIPYLAIIPAKAHSERCPGKNTRLLGGIPLFLHSVHYAIQEGFTPIVSTDSEEIISLCREKNILHHREIVYERKMTFCIRQVLNTHSCRYFAILQPTSPLRQQGLLRTMLRHAETHGEWSGYTSQKIKVIGHLDGSFQHAFRTQDAKRFLHFFDGNISLTSQAGFLARDSFFGDDSRIHDNPFPCNLQIDTEQEFAVLEHLCDSPRFRNLLPHPAGTTRICLVSNKKNLQRNYSEFVDSCDLVMRINKMENLHSGLAGTRTDMALISCCGAYMAFPREKRNTDILPSIPMLYFNDEDPNRTQAYAYTENLAHWRTIPPDVSRCTHNFTTLSKGILLAYHLYPNASIYYLGDCDMNHRVSRIGKHQPEPENAFIQSMISSGCLIPILEDSDPEHRYSCAGSAPAAPPSIRTSQRLLPPANIQPAETLRLWHPEWSDDFRIIGNRGARLAQKDAALILQRDETTLQLQWDRWGKERFIRETGEWYHWVQPAPATGTSPKRGNIRKIGFMRVLNEQHTIAACMLSVAAVLDDLLILWADMDDRSIELAEQWKPVLENEYGCRCHFLHYPHHIVRPHSACDLRTLPKENRIDTYYQFGMNYINQLFGKSEYAVVKVDADQIYLPEHLGQAFSHIRTPMDCISISGHNTAVLNGRFGLYKPIPRNGGCDSHICGSGNLPRYGIAQHYEIDTAPHPNKKTVTLPCWLHFMKTARYEQTIRDFREDEIEPAANRPALLRAYKTRILPLLQRTRSPYAALNPA